MKQYPEITIEIDGEVRYKSATIDQGQALFRLLMSYHARMCLYARIELIVRDLAIRTTHGDLELEETVEVVARWPH